MECTETPLEQIARMLGFDSKKIPVTAAADIAAFVVAKFNGQIVDEKSAALAFCDVIIDVPFEEIAGEEARRIREKALGFLAEIINAGRPDREFNAEEAAVTQGMLGVQEKTLDEVREFFNRSPV